MKSDFDFSVCKNKRVCVAFSGGGDSVALLHYLHSHAEEFSISLSAVNVEHGIRGESSLRDSRFAKDFCERYSVPLYAYTADVPALAKQWNTGLEDAARRVRYRIFYEILRDGKADFIATAHQASDNAESVLFNLFRGSSLAGAGGIRTIVPFEELARRFSDGAVSQENKSRAVIRPILNVGKAQLKNYLAENGLQWCEDESNEDTAYTRNFLRKEVLPTVAERFPNAESSLYAFSRIARESDEFLKQCAKQYYRVQDGACLLSVKAERVLFFHCIKRAFGRFGIEKDYTYSNFEDVYALKFKQNGAETYLPNGLVAVREYDEIVLYRPQEPCKAVIPFSVGAFSFGEFTLRILDGNDETTSEQECCGRVLTIDADRLPQGCVIRGRETGDVFEKFGGGTKKLKEFFIDKKIPKRKRDFYPVLACGHEIYAVCGVELSERVRMGKTTKNRYKLVLTKAKEN